MRHARRLVPFLLAGGLLAAAAPSAAAAGGGAPVFSPPVIVDTAGNSAAEPSIRSSADGTLYITAPAGLGSAGIPRTVATAPLATSTNGGDLLWRSTDGGATWTYLGSYDGSTGGGDSDITTTPDGTVYATGLTLACLTVSKSTDKGNTFTPPNPVGGCGYTVADDRQWNDVYGNGALYTGFGNIVTRNLLVNKTLITAPVPTSGTNTTVSVQNNYQWPGVLDVDQRNGTVYMAWNTTGSPNDCDAANGCNGVAASTVTPDEIRIAVLDQNLVPVAGSPFLVASRRFDTFDSFVGIDTGRDGTVWASWSERHPELSRTDIMLASSTDAGRTWSAPQKVSQAPLTATFPWVSAGDAGRVAVTYYGTATGGRSPETVVGDWAVYTALSTDGAATFTETKTTPTMHQGTICTSGTGCASGARDLADFIETDYDAAGCVVTTYTDNSRDVVTATGTRTTNNPERIAFVRQSGGAGLLATQDCGASGPTAVVPEAPLTALLPLAAALALGVAVVRRRRPA